MTRFPQHLRTISRAISAEDVDTIIRGEPVTGDLAEAVPVVERPDGSNVDLVAFFSVLKVGAGLAWSSKTDSDAWFAPRLHWSLKLTRREAADPGVWEWLAYRLSRTYVQWRWSGEDGAVAANRYRGGINKQAFARLWWGAELFRNGDDYGPVERFFFNQDFPSSYVHREFSRNRPLALALVDEIHRRTAGAPSSDQINDVARNVNLWLAPLTVDVATGHWRPDVERYVEWVQSPASEHVPVRELPAGPMDGRVSGGIEESARALASEICESAGL